MERISKDKIAEIDARISKIKRKEDAKLVKANYNTRDFQMTR